MQVGLTIYKSIYPIIWLLILAVPLMQVGFNYLQKYISYHLAPFSYSAIDAGRFNYFLALICKMLFLVHAFACMT